MGQLHFRRFPIVLLQIGEPANIDLVRQLIQAHAYWRLKGLAVDLVICNEDHAGYRQALHDQIMGLIAAGAEANLMRSARWNIRETARPDVGGGSYPASVSGPRHHQRQPGNAGGTDRPPQPCGADGSRSCRRPAPTAADPPRRRVCPVSDLIFFNGVGGFTPDGREYVITIAPGQVTPAPWVNVLANPSFGTIVSESGCCLHMERERARVSSHALVQRSGKRFRRRGLLPSGRGERTFLVAYALPSRGTTSYVMPARIRLQRVRPYGAMVSTPNCGFTWRWTHRSSSRC